MPLSILSIRSSDSIKEYRAQRSCRLEKVRRHATSAVIGSGGA